MFFFLFYRAISFAITGAQSSHLTIRKAIVNHMTTKTEELKSHVQHVEEHLGKMTTTSEWVTNTELFAAASLLQTDICCGCREEIGPCLDEMSWKSHVVSAIRTFMINVLFTCNILTVTI